MGEGAIFIAGLSYSGKTQLRLMLSAHPNIVITRRTYMWRRYYRCFGDLEEDENLDRCLATMMATPHIRELDPDLESIRREFRRGEASYARLFALIRQDHAARQGKARWGDQFGSLEYDADLILSSYPQAVILHMVRDPFARVAESLTGSSHRTLKVGWETMRWRRSAQAAIRNLKTFPNRYLPVRCEELFSNPEHALREVCAFLGEPFDPKMMAVEGLPGMGVNVPGARLPIDTGARQSAEQDPYQLRATERAFVQSRLEKERAYFGYSGGASRPSGADLLWYGMVGYPLNLAGEFLWRIWGRRSSGLPEWSFQNRS